MGATLYDEIVVQALFAGKRQLHHSLRPLLRSAEKVLNLSRAQRQRTLVRLDSGGGESAHINWLLRRGYAVLVKAHGTAPAKKLAQSVTAWTTDPHDDGRQMAFIAQGYPYATPPSRSSCARSNRIRPGPMRCWSVQHPTVKITPETPQNNRNKKSPAQRF